MLASVYTVDSRVDTDESRYPLFTASVEFTGVFPIVTIVSGENTATVEPSEYPCIDIEEPR